MSLKPILSQHLYQPPLLVVNERTVRAIVSDAPRYETETGEPMVGIVIPSGPGQPWAEPTIVILGTMPPGESTRQAALFVTGNDFQVKVMEWYKENWDAVRTQSRSMSGYETYEFQEVIRPGFIPKMWDYPLIWPGDWHRHPGGLNNPSGGDFNTAASLIKDPANGVPFLVQPIITIGSPQVARQSTLTGHLLTYNRDFGGGPINISWYYLSRKILSRGGSYIQVKPEIVADDLLPQLPPLSWDLENPNRLQLETQLLRQYGIEFRMFYRDTNGEPPLEVCFVCRRPYTSQPWDNMVLIETDARYPHAEPQVRVVAREQTDAAQIQAEPPAEQEAAQLRQWFETVWKRAVKKPIEQIKLLIPPRGVGSDSPIQVPSDQRWSSNHTLLGLIMALELEGAVWQRSTEQ